MWLCPLLLWAAVFSCETGNIDRTVLHDYGKDKMENKKQFLEVLEILGPVPVTQCPLLVVMFIYCQNNCGNAESLLHLTFPCVLVFHSSPQSRLICQHINCILNVSFSSLSFLFGFIHFYLVNFPESILENIISLSQITQITLCKLKLKLNGNNKKTLKKKQTHKKIKLKLLWLVGFQVLQPTSLYFLCDLPVFKEHIHISFPGIGARGCSLELTNLYSECISLCVVLCLKSLVTL